jgi:hypothetical protein
MKAKDLKNNKLAQMFNLSIVKKEIKNCPKDETIILLPHYSINKPKYNDEENLNQSDYWDFCDLEQYLNCSLLVSDYDDLIADPQGIYNL